MLYEEQTLCFSNDGVIYGQTLVIMNVSEVNSMVTAQKNAALQHSKGTEGSRMGFLVGFVGFFLGGVCIYLEGRKRFVLKICVWLVYVGDNNSTGFTLQ